MRRHPLLLVIAIICLILPMSIAWAGDAFTWPVRGEIIKEFSPGEHRGIDISANVGDSVSAAYEGIVHWIGKTPRGESYVSIDHPNGLTTTYLPVKASVSKGQVVSTGEKIGILSSEGDISSDDPHLHLGLFDTSTRGKEKYLDPAEYLFSNGARKEMQEEEATVVAERVVAGSGKGQSSVEQAPAREDLTTSKTADVTAIQEAALTSPDIDTTLSSGPVPSGALPNLRVEGNEISHAYLSRNSAYTFPGNTQGSRTGGTPISPLMPSSIGLAEAGLVKSRMEVQESTDNIDKIAVGAGIQGNAVVQSSPTGNKRQVKTAGTSGPGAELAGDLGIAPTYYERSSVNPFITPANDSSLTELADKKSAGINGTASKPMNSWMNRVFKWRLLPDVISAITIVIIVMLSIQSVRRTRQMRAVTLTEPGYCARF